MPTYITLGHFTDQGIHNVKDSPNREEAFRELCERLGARVKDAYRTMGRYDVVAIVDCLQNQKDTQKKILWVLLILLLPLVGLILYYLMGKEKN